MPPFEHMDRRQKAIWFAKSGVDSYGENTYDSPEEINVRWNSNRRQSTDSQGNPIGLDASVVFFDDVREGDLLSLGLLEDWLGTGSNDTDQELMQVVSISVSKDLKGRTEGKSAQLQRYKGRLP